MGFFEDLKPVFAKHKLSFIEQRKETGNIVSFLFKPDSPVSWKAGQHGIIFFPRKLKGGSSRGFSIASYPGEGIILISTRIAEKPSEYKQELLKLQPGDQLIMRGPVGPFHLDGSKKPVVFIAGGIGITPYRSLILYSTQNPVEVPSSIQLLYTDDTGRYAFLMNVADILQNELHMVAQINGKNFSEHFPDRSTSLTGTPLMVVAAI